MRADLSKQWTTEIDRELAALYSTGVDVATLASQFECSEKSLRSRVSTLGLLRRRTRTNQDGRGNTAWVIGPALAAVMHVPADGFCEDLIAQLDGR